MQTGDILIISNKYRVILKLDLGESQSLAKKISNSVKLLTILIKHICTNWVNIFFFNLDCVCLKSTLEGIQI